MSAVGTLVTLGLAWLGIIGAFYLLYRFDGWYTRRGYGKPQPRRR
jgi:hypothetical protein